MIFCGVDPGLTGALAVLGEDGGFLGVYDTPSYHVRTGKRQRGRYDIPAVLRLLDSVIEQAGMLHRIVVMIEQVNPNPKSRGGVIAAASAGYGAGVWHTACAAKSISLREVHPSVWKRHAHLIGQDKNGSRLMATKRWPTAPLDRVKDHGRAEALLLAQYGRDVHQMTAGVHPMAEAY